MRVALCCITYDDHRFLGPFIRQIPDWVENITFLVSERPWNGDVSPDAVKTLDALRSCADQRVRWHRFPWKTESDQRNWGLGSLKDYDWVLILDTDEFIVKEDWECLRERLESAHLGTAQAVCELTTYWKDWDHVFSPPDTHMPTVAVRPNRAVFTDKRIVSDDSHVKLPFRIHHLSWARTDDEVFRKIQNYSHAFDFDADKWYNEVWKKWTPEMTDIRPYGVEKGTKAVFFKLPEEIRALFG